MLHFFDVTLVGSPEVENPTPTTSNSTWLSVVTNSGAAIIGLSGGGDTGLQINSSYVIGVIVQPTINASTNDLLFKGMLSVNTNPARLNYSQSTGDPVQKVDFTGREIIINLIMRNDWGSPYVSTEPHVLQYGDESNNTSPVYASGLYSFPAPAYIKGHPWITQRVYLDGVEIGSSISK